MYRAILCLLFLATVCWGNEIRNGDFQAGLKHWLHNIKGLKVDPAVKAGNLPAVPIVGPGNIRQDVQLEPDTLYELTFMVKGEKINDVSPSDQGARVQLQGGKAWRRVTGDNTGKCMTGSFDWKKIKTQFNTGSFKTGKIRIWAVLNTTGTCWFADFQLKKVGPAPAAVKEEKTGLWFRESYLKEIPLPSLYPLDAAWGILFPGEPAKFKLDAKGQNLTREVTVRGMDGAVVYHEKPQSYNPEEPISVPGQKRGYYVVEVLLYSGDRKAAMVQGGFAVVAPPAEKRDPFFLVNQYGIAPELFQGYLRVGVGSFSLPIVFLKESPQSYVKSRFTGEKARFRRFLDSGLPVYFCFGPGFPIYNADPERVKKGYPLMEDKWLKKMESVLSELAGAVKGKAAGYDIIMEMPSHASMRHKYSGSWTESMSELYFTSRIASRTVRALDPKARIGIGGCNIPSYLVPYDKIVMTDLIKDFDDYCIDAYPGNWNLTSGRPGLPEGNLRSFYLEASKLSESLGKGKMIRNTETGYNIYYGSRYDRGLAVLQAALTARLLIISKSAPVSAVSLYHFGIYYGNYSKSTGGCMTTVWKPVPVNGRIHHCPLPGSAAYATVSKEFAFAEFKQEIISGDKTIYAYIFKRPDGKTLIALWQIEGTGKLKLKLEKDAQYISLFGNEKTLPAGETTLELTPQPFYLVTDEEAEPIGAQLQQRIVAMRPLFTGAGKLLPDGKVRVFLRNSGRETATFQQEGKAVKILPESIGSLDCSWKKGEKLTIPAPDGTKLEIAVSDNTVRAFRVRTKPVFDGSGNWYKDIPPIRLRYPKDIQPVDALQPERGFFRDALNPNGHNLAADCYLGYDDEYLYLAANVDDPIHQQRRKGTSIWMDDSLQIVAANRPAPPQTARFLNTPKSVFTSELNFGAALTDGQTTLVAFFPPVTTDGCRAKVTRRNGWTRYEVALLWKTLGSAPGKPFYLGFVIFNNDTTAPTAPYWLESCRGVAGGRDDAFLPLVVFEK